MGPKSTAEKTVLDVAVKNGLAGIFSIALLVGMWLILNQYIAQADCARQEAAKCQQALIEVNAENTKAMIILNTTLTNLQSEVGRLSRAIEALERRTAHSKNVDTPSSARVSQ
jgi:hypothetical protein